MKAPAQAFRWSDVALWALTAIMLTLGGAGDAYPIVGAILQTCAVAMILLSDLQLRRGGPAIQKLPVSARWVIGAIIVYVAMQFAPLPEGIWSAMPGRSLARELRSAAGLPANWHALSLDPDRTVRAALELLPGMAMLTAGVRGTAARRRGFVAVVLLVAVSSAIIGGLQRLSASPWLVPFDNASSNSPGLFVNRNHQASFLLTAIPLAAYWSITHGSLKRVSPALWAVLTWGTILIFAAVIILTTSRAGFLLLALAMAVAAAILHHDRIMTRTIVPLTAFLAVGFLAAIQVGSVQRTLDRFWQEQDNRPELTATTTTLARQYLPLGSGLGTFQLVFVTGEPRNRLTEAFVNDAHNDYAEAWLEGGVLALGVLAVLAIVVVRSAKVGFAREQSGEQRHATGAAVAVLALLALHSAVDYPLRMMTLMAVAGLSMALLLADDPMTPLSARGRRPRPAGRPDAQWLSRTGWAFRIAVALAVLVPIWGTAIARSRLDAGDALAALTLDPWSSDAWVAAGQQALDGNNEASARAFGARALAISPLNAAAVGIMVQADILANETARADRLLAVARRLGWREPHIQYALMREAAERNNFAAAVLRADALLRTGTSSDLILTFLRKLELNATANSALVEVLASSPDWRRAFLSNIQDLNGQAVAAHAALLGGLAASGSPPTGGEADALSQYLIAHHRPAEAAYYAQYYHRSLAMPRIPDAAATAGLNEWRGSSDPFAWRAGDAIGIAVNATSQGAVEIASPRAASGIVLSRLMVAKAGPYTLRAVIDESSLGSWSAFNWGLVCEGSSQIIPSPSRYARPASGVVYVELQFTVPPINCSAQTLQLNLDSSLGSRVGIKLKRLNIYPT